MFHKIEPLGTASHLTPGWAYVADTGSRGLAGSRKPSGVRKRAARETGAGRADVSSRQNTAIQKHLAELDRDSHKDAHIPVPKNLTTRSSKVKITPNMRKALGSLKTFKNYVDDEEALIANNNQTGPNIRSAGHQRPAKPLLTPSASAFTPASASRSSGPATPRTEPSSGPEQQRLPHAPPSAQVPTSSQLITSEHDSDPLLKSYIPSAPSERVMRALLSEPPLSYTASRASLPSSSSSATTPQRHFCGICGYWGRVKCMKCGARTCGLDCYRLHEETRCDRFYA